MLFPVWAPARNPAKEAYGQSGKYDEAHNKEPKNDKPALKHSVRYSWYL